MVYHTGRTSCHLLQWIGADQCTDHSVPVDGLSGSKHEIDQDCGLGNRLFIMDWAFFASTVVSATNILWYLNVVVCFEPICGDTHLIQTLTTAMKTPSLSWNVLELPPSPVSQCSYLFNVNYILEKKVLLSLPPWLSAQFFPYFA